MSRAAAIKAQVTRRSQRADELGVELKAEQPLNVLADDDTGFEICIACGDVMGVVHVCSAQIFAARESVLDSMTPILRAWGWSFITFLLGEGPRPKLPSGLEAEARTMELHIATFGLADPDGFATGVDLLRCKRKGPRRHTATGKMPDALRQHLTNRRNHRSALWSE